MMAVAVAAAPWESEEGNSESADPRGLGFSEFRYRIALKRATRKCLGWGRHVNSLKTDIKTGEGDASVAVYQSPNDLKRALFAVRVRSVGSLCPAGAGDVGKLNWHIHAKPVGNANGGQGAACGPTVTGGHYDPTYGCGGASAYQGGLCVDLCEQCNADGAACTQDRGTDCTGNGGKAPKRACNRDDPHTTCEIGDQSGKLGKVDPKKSYQFFCDDFMTGLDKIENRALVFHCCKEVEGSLNCGERILCGDLK